MKKPNSALAYVLKALVPYTRPNLLLTYKPHLFFRELEHTSGYSRPTLRTALWRARKSGLVTADTVPRLTARGRQKLQPFVAQKLRSNAKLLVIFDVPEARAPVRRQFRLLLRSLEFRQIQLSVWMTEYDHREVIMEAINELSLHDEVQLFEAARLLPE